MKLTQSLAYHCDSEAITPDSYRDAYCLFTNLLIVNS